jgi:NTP pyrophosphatase (non-canonical NTP hydrolase)
MKPNEYQELCQRTAIPSSEQAWKIIDELEKMPKKANVMIAALKLNSESGELADAIVKHMCYGQPFDSLNIKEECGDLLWYIALILTNLNYTMEECMKDNINKLQIRYPEKFTEEHAKERLDKKKK